MDEHQLGARVRVKGTGGSVDGKFGMIVARGHEGRWTVDLGPDGRRNLRPENLEVSKKMTLRSSSTPASTTSVSGPELTTELDLECTPRRSISMVCIVCASEDLESKLPCCGAAVCTSCLQSTAAAAGKFFSCPSCRSDDDSFLSHVAALGVEPDETIPAWMDETDERMVVRRMCTAKKCKSPRGPGFDTSGFMSTRGVGDQREWRLIACSSCGQSAIHPGCTRNLSESWRCDDCGGAVDGDKTVACEVDEFRVGDAVEARWRGGSKWFDGQIRKVDTKKETRWLVAFSDGDTEWIDREIRLRRPKQKEARCAKREEEAPTAPKGGHTHRGFYGFWDSQRASIDEELGDMAELSARERLHLRMRKASERWQALDEETRNNWRAGPEPQEDEEEARRTLPPRKAAGKMRAADEDEQQRKKVKRAPSDARETRGAKVAAQQRVKEPKPHHHHHHLNRVDRSSLLAKMEADGWVVESIPRRHGKENHVDHYYHPPCGGDRYKSLTAVAREHFPEHIVACAKEKESSEEAQVKTRSCAEALEERVPAATPAPVAKKLKVVETKSKADRKAEETSEAAKAQAEADRSRILELERRVRGLERENAKLREDAERAPAPAAAPTREHGHDEVLRSALDERDGLWEAALTRAETEARLFARLANLEAGWKPTPRPPAPSA